MGAWVLGCSSYPPMCAPPRSSCTRTCSACSSCITIHLHASARPASFSNGVDPLPPPASMGHCPPPLTAGRSRCTLQRSCAALCPPTPASPGMCAWCWAACWMAAGGRGWGVCAGVSRLVACTVPPACCLWSAACPCIAPPALAPTQHAAPTLIYRFEEFKSNYGKTLVTGESTPV